MSCIRFGMFLLWAAAAAAASTSFSITNLAPASNLLAPGTGSVTVSFNTSETTTCGWSLSSGAALDAMTPFDQEPAASHQGLVTGLSTDTRVVSTVYIACAADP